MPPIKYWSAIALADLTDASWWEERIWPSIMFSWVSGHHHHHHHVVDDMTILLTILWYGSGDQVGFKSVAVAVIGKAEKSALTLSWLQLNMWHQMMMRMMMRMLLMMMMTNPTATLCVMKLRSPDLSKLGPPGIVSSTFRSTIISRWWWWRRGRKCWCKLSYNPPLHEF